MEKELRIAWETKIEPRDLWVGLFWDRRGDELHLYFCFFTLLLHLIVTEEHPTFGA